MGGIKTDLEGPDPDSRMTRRHILLPICDATPAAAEILETMPGNGCLWQINDPQLMLSLVQLFCFERLIGLGTRSNEARTGIPVTETGDGTML